MGMHDKCGEQDIVVAQQSGALTRVGRLDMHARESVYHVDVVKELVARVVEWWLRARS